MRNLEIDLDHLTYLFQQSDRILEYYISTETGEIVSAEDLAENLDEKGQPEERFIEVPTSDPQEAFQDMVKFAGTVEDAEIRRALTSALDGKGAFRRFRDALSDCPQQMQRWYAFKDEQTKRRVRELLEALEIAPKE